VSTGIEAAWIGAAAVVAGGLVTIAGAVVNGWNTRQVAETTIEGEHRQRLWEKQSAAYEDTVREVLARRTRRNALTSRGDVGNIGLTPIKEMRKAEEPESIRVRSALRAYASEAVWAAYEKADEANNEFWVSLGRLQSANYARQHRAERQQAGEREGQLPPAPDYQTALHEMNESKGDAWVFDEGLFDAINRELVWGRSSTRTPKRRWFMRRPARAAGRATPTGIPAPGRRP
jgi:hypothetical protein